MSHPRKKFSNMILSVQEPTGSLRLPFDRLDGNFHTPVCGVISSQTVSSAAASLQESHPAVRREQHRRKLAGLHHAAHCTQGVACRGQQCMAYKRIYSHMISCRQGASCMIPGCSKARLIWTHFSTCTSVDCDICSVIPVQDRKMVQPPGKAHLPRSPKSVASPSRWPGRPPLSPKPRCHPDLPPRSPPRSPLPKLP